jgi:hypothetical protein
MRCGRRTFLPVNSAIYLLRSSLHWYSKTTACSSVNRTLWFLSTCILARISREPAGGDISSKNALSSICYGRVTPRSLRNCPAIIQKAGKEFVPRNNQFAELLKVRTGASSSCGLTLQPEQPQNLGHNIFVA